MFSIGNILTAFIIGLAVFLFGMAIINGLNDNRGG